MEKATVRVVKRMYRRTPVGGTLELSRRDARILSNLGLVEIVPPADDVEFTPSERLDEGLATPEAPLENVAHTDAKPRKRKSTRKKKAKE